MTYQTPEPDGTPRVFAWVYAGDWVGSCPRPGCGNVEFLYQASQLNGPRDSRKPFFHCSYCGLQAHIVWPRREHQILQVLMVRPIPGTRNWYPADHPDAINFRLPHGQTVKDLLDENEEHGVDNAPLKGLI